MLINRISALAVLLCGVLIPLPAMAEKTVPVLAVGSEIDFPPYAIVDAKGRASGFSVELLEAVADAMGLSVKVKTGQWPEVLAAFKSGKTDLLPLVALSPQRADMATYTKPHTVAYDSFFVRRGSPPISSLAEAKGKEVIVMTSDAAHEALLHSGQPVKIIETKTIPEAMRLLATGRHDAVLVPKLLGLIVLRELKLEGVVEAGKPVADYNRKFAFAVQRGNTELRDKLEQGLAIVHTTGRYDAIYKKWFGGVDYLGRHLKTIIVNNYQPYTFMNDKGEPDGFSVEITRAAAKAMGLELEIRADKWDQAMKELEDGSIDLLPMMAHSTERDKIFDFSVPHTIAYDAIFLKKGNSDLRTLNDLSGKTVIVMNRDIAHSYLLSSGLSKTMKLTLVDSLPEALKLLSSGKGDAAIMPKLVGIVTAKRLNLSEIETSPQLVDAYTRPFSFAVKEGNKPLLERLNQGLNIIKSSGEYDVIYKKWFGALEDPHLELKTVLKYGAVAAAFLMVFFIWNIMLKRQVRSKTEHLEKEIAERKLLEEELRFQSEIMSNMAEAVYLIRMEDGVIVYANSIFEEMFGYGKDELIGKHVSDVNDPSEKIPEETAREIMGILSEKGAWQGEVNNIRKDGTPFWSYANVSLFEHSKFGKVLVSVHTDVTERKKIDEMLRDSEEKYRLLVNNLSSGVVVHALDSSVIFSNQMASTLLGLSKDQMRGKDAMDPAWSFLRENGTPTPLAEYPVNRVLSSGEPIANHVLGIRRPDLAEPVWVQCNAYPVSAADGTLLQVVVTFSDITGLKVYEKNLQQKNAELERFTYTVSHDLKSPLITIKGFAGSLEKDLANGNYERMARDLKRVSDAADRMNDLLRDLLELSTIGRIINTPDAVDMSMLVADVLAQLAGPLKNRNLTVDVQPGLPEVSCDKRRMAEVLQNLLENAINYMGEQAEPQIQFGMREEGGENIFFVQDNGIGIDEKFHRIIFGLFNKLDAESSGTGVGLAIVKRIIEVHGGRVWVESEGEGKGSRFCFTVDQPN